KKEEILNMLGMTHTDKEKRVKVFDNVNEEIREVESESFISYLWYSQNEGFCIEVRNMLNLLEYSNILINKLENVIKVMDNEVLKEKLVNCLDMLIYLIQRNEENLNDYISGYINEFNEFF